MSTMSDDDLVENLAAEYAAAVDADPREAILTACRVAYVGMRGVYTGSVAVARRQHLADATSRAMARIRFPDDSAAQERALSIAANQSGGASVSATAIAQRVTAYRDVLDAGVEPTVASVSAAFTLASIGGSKTAREEVQRRVQGGEDFTAVSSELAKRLGAELRRRGPKREQMVPVDVVRFLATDQNALTSLDESEFVRLCDVLTQLNTRVEQERSRRQIA